MLKLSFKTCLSISFLEDSWKVSPGCWLSTSKFSQLARPYKLFHSLKYSLQALGINTTTNDLVGVCRHLPNIMTIRQINRGEAIALTAFSRQPGTGPTRLRLRIGHLWRSLLADSRMWVVFAVFTGHTYSFTVHSHIHAHLLCENKYR